MRRHPSTLLGAAGVLFSLGGCRQFLDSSRLNHNPNNPSNAPATALFVAAQISYFSQQEGHLARTVALWMEQFSGQASPFNSLSLYQYGVDDYYNNWSRAYAGGGLIDIRTVEQRSLALGDSIFVGQAIVLEALQISETADIWGDVPYSQASQPKVHAQPKVDAQQVVYDSLLHALTTAITYMADTTSAQQATNAGAGVFDFAFGGSSSLQIQSASWIAVAHTLRARLFMHMAAKLGAVAYDSALSEAALGITDPSGAGDYVTVHNATAATANLWSDFQSVYPGYVAAASTMIGLMNAGADPRLPKYWTQGDSGTYFGATPGVAPPDPARVSQLSSTRSAQTFAQPIVTYAENTLIQAEASCQIGLGAQALVFLQAEQAAAGVPPTATVSLHAIMNEKYIALFQNIETWNDWKRTGFPTLLGTPPRRLTYPLTEREANPNIPTDPVTNWNDTGPVTSNCG